MIPLMAYKRKYVTVYRYSLLAEAVAGNPSKNSNNRTIESARSTMRGGKRRRKGESYRYMPLSLAGVEGGRAYKRTFTVALQRSSKQMLKMVLTSAQLTSKTFSTF